MKVFVNEKEKEIRDGLNVLSFVKELYPDSKGGVAVAVNDGIVRKPDWESHILAEGDKIVIIHAAYGG